MHKPIRDPGRRPTAGRPMPSSASMPRSGGADRAPSAMPTTPASAAHAAVDPGALEYASWLRRLRCPGA